MVWKWIKKIKFSNQKTTNILIIFLTLVIAVSGIFQTTSMGKQTKAIEGSYLPQVFITAECPEKLGKGQSSYFEIGLANYGKIPTRLSWEWSYENIFIDKLENSERVEIEKYGGPFILVPIEYKNNEKFKIDQLNTKIINESDFKAEFSFKYSFERKNKILTNEFNCRYFDIDGDGTFEKQNQDNVRTLYMIKLKN